MTDRHGSVPWSVAGVRFVLEVLALLILGYWGYQAGTTTLTRWLLAVGLPGGIAVLWGLFGSPAAPYRLPPFARLSLELAIFGGATAALWAVRDPVVALSFGVIALATSALLHAAERRAAR